MINNDKEVLQDCPIGTYYLRSSQGETEQKTKTLVFVNSSLGISKYKLVFNSDNVSLLNNEGKPVALSMGGIFLAPAVFSSIEQLLNYLEKTGINQNGCLIKFQKVETISLQKLTNNN